MFLNPKMIESLRQKRRENNDKGFDLKNDIESKREELSEKSNVKKNI